MKQISIYLFLCLTAPTFAVDIVIDRSLDEGRRAIIYHESTIEITPIETEGEKQGWRRIKGGEIINDCYVLQVTSSDLESSCSIAWIKSDTVTQALKPES